MIDIVQLDAWGKHFARVRSATRRIVAVPAWLLVFESVFLVYAAEGPALADPTDKPPEWMNPSVAALAISLPTSAGATIDTARLKGEIPRCVLHIDRDLDAKF